MDIHCYSAVGEDTAIERRATLRFMAAIATAPCLAFAQAERRVHRVGFIATTSPLAEISGPDPANPFVRAFVHGLRDLGYVQGKNLVPQSIQLRADRVID